MTSTRRAHIGLLTGIASIASVLRGSDTNQDVLSWSDADRERFLQNAKIVSATPIGHGVTKPVRVELELGDVRHAAKVQVVDKALPDFFGEAGPPVPMRDSWRFNIAAYKLDRLLGVGMVTVAAPRSYAGKPAGFSWWVDNVMFEEVDRIRKDIAAPSPEDFERQRCVTKVFDELIINIDRNLSNLLITHSWKLALIDHSRSFTPYKAIRNKANLTRCSLSLLASMRSLTPASVRSAVGVHLNAAEVAALLARRDKIVDHFVAEVSVRGEASVLF